MARLATRLKSHSGTAAAFFRLCSAAMSVWAGLVIALLVLTALLAAQFIHFRRVLVGDQDYADVLALTTADGARIELRRLPPPEPPLGPPVLLVHGLGANHRNNDALPNRSLARHLSAHGRDVWLVTLRSGMPGLKRKDARGVRFEKMVEQDLPLAVETILERTGRAQLDYVGFSMGGMVLYAAIGETVPPQALRRVAIVGSPALVRAPGGFRVPRWVAAIPSWAMPTLRLRRWSFVAAPLAGRVGTHLPSLIANTKNLAAADIAPTMANIVADIPGPLHVDFARWAASRTGELTFEDKPVLPTLRELEVPAIFFAGTVDQLAPPSSVRAAHDAWGADAADCPRQFMLVGVETGSARDYGHGDLAIGLDVARDIFDPLTAFLAVGITSEASRVVPTPGAGPAAAAGRARS